jgi:hypothetical protein
MAQDDEYYQDAFVRNQDYIYHKNIHTVLLHRVGNELSAPIIDMKLGDKLFLSFDDLDGFVKDYRYTVIHCDAYWNESEILKQEYIAGFMDDEILTYRNSFNTLQQYTNYQLVFPTDNLRLKKSGNYILKVFVGYEDEENVAFTRRFMVVEQLVGIRAEVTKTTDLDMRYTGQQVEFKIIPNNYRIHDPYRDIHVVIRQNERWDNAVMNIRPRMVLGNEIDYSLIRELAFEAGNEFRYFDMKTVRYKTDQVQILNATPEAFEVYLYPDRVNSKRSYLTEDDINGRRLIASNQARDWFTESEYAWVNFVIPYSQPFLNGNVYVMGELSNWQFSNENRMEYDFDLKAYTATLYLKQGYYNYCYGFLEDGSTTAYVAPFEGSHWETENEYSIFVYHRDPGLFFDRLIAVAQVNSAVR